MKKKTHISYHEASLIKELKEFKAFLGPAADHYTDGQLRQYRDDLFALADIMLDLFLARKKDPEQPPIEF